LQFLLCFCVAVLEPLAVSGIVLGTILEELSGF
jgi:hypothetical protein